ncbi:MAG: glucodextranase DOMON-like domain-containing protein [Elusimicrobiota bacterium]
MIRYSALLAFFLGLAAAAQAAPAVLWIPSEHFNAWTEFAGAFISAGYPSMTIALSPNRSAENALKEIKSFVDAGKIEIALRIPGDPILPLIVENSQAPRSQDALDRLALSRERFERVWGFTPQGFAAGGGATSPDIFASYKAAALSWVAVGDYPHQPGRWAQASGVVLVPCLPLSSPDAAPPAGTLVVDESDGVSPKGTMLTMLAQAAASGQKLEWSTLSQATAAHQPLLTDSSLIPSWPTWAEGGDYAPWNSSVPSQNAWQAYGKAAMDIELYQNSGSANLRSLEIATNHLYQAQSSRFFRLIASSDPAVAIPADRQFRGHLTRIYQDIDEPRPDALSQPLITISSFTLSLATASESAVADQFNDIRITSSQSSLAFYGSPQSQAYVFQSSGPAILSMNSPWKIIGFSIDWSTTSIDFNYRLQASTNSIADAEHFFSRIILDTYIDVNHIPGAGSTQLLSGRNAYTKVADAWEYALSLDSKEGFFYRFTENGPPQLISTLPVQSQSQNSTFSISIPRELLGGNPRRWGYIVASLASIANSPTEPPAIGSNLDSSAIFGLLAPIESQELFFAHPLTERLGALRVPGF